MQTVPKLLDLEVRALRPSDLDAVAMLHRACFPEKIESLLGAACIVDTYRERCCGPDADAFALAALRRPNGRHVGFICGAVPGATGMFAHAFIGRAALRRHLLRRAAFSPGVWRFVLRRVVRKLFDGPPNEGDALPLGAESCVIKPVGVAPECRFSNAAVDLMQAGEAEARRRGATRLIGLVERSNTKAARLYAFLGWARTSPEREDFGVYAMHKDLAPP